MISSCTVLSDFRRPSHCNLEYGYTNANFSRNFVIIFAPSVKPSNQAKNQIQPGLFPDLKIEVKMSFSSDTQFHRLRQKMEMLLHAVENFALLVVRQYSPAEKFQKMQK